MYINYCLVCAYLENHADFPKPVFIWRGLCRDTTQLIYINVVNNLNLRLSRKIILIISILICSLSYGQYDWTSGKLILKNGESLKGLIKIPQVTHGLLSFPKNKLEYKKDKKGKKKKFDETQVDKVFFATFDP